jgi:hypothetical protein
VRFLIEQRFDGLLEDVEAAFLDEAFLVKLATLPKLGDLKLVRRVDAHPLIHQWVRYRFTGDLAPAVRRVVDPNRLTWVEESTLDTRNHRTIWRIVPDNYSHLLKASGTYELRTANGGNVTLRTADGDLRVSVPLVGGRVEAAIVSGLREHAALEEGVMAEWLAAMS